MRNKTDFDEKKKVTIYMDKDAYNLTELYINSGIARVRGDFISEAVRMYSAWLDGQNYTDFLTPAFESVVEGVVKDSLGKTSKNLFKLSVEVCMLIHAIAIAYDFNDNIIEKLRADSIKEVKSIRGIMPFEDIVKIEESRRE